MNEKFILDACCSGRMFWFNKNHPNTVYQDIRKEEKGFIPEQPNFEINPDVIGDFRNMSFEDKSFKLIVFDPPHAEISNKSIIGKKYGFINDVGGMLEDGFKECWRVLDDYGTLIFKWNEVKYSLSDIKHLFPCEPLFGHTTAKSGKTKWVCFMKIPTNE